MAEKIEMEAVTSSNLAALGYNPQKKILAVQFKNGRIFHYSNVPLATVETIYGAGSRGKAYADLVKGKFPGELMTGECNKCGDGPGWGGDTCEDCGTGVYTVPARPEVTRA